MKILCTLHPTLRACKKRLQKIRIRVPQLDNETGIKAIGGNAKAFQSDQVNEAFLNQLVDEMYGIQYLNFDDIKGNGKTNDFPDKLAEYRENEVTPRYAKRGFPVLRGDENGLCARP